MLDSQREFIDRLVDTVVERGIDVVLIAGDVYDRALPPVESVELLDEALARIRQAGAEVIITSGNHDSATRLGFGGRLMDSSGVYVRTRSEYLHRPVVVGDDQDTVAVYGIPYLEPRMVAEKFETEPNHTAVMETAMGRIRENLAELKDSGEYDTPVTSIVMAHLFAAGGSGSDSERDIGEGRVQGGLGQVPASVFDGVDYAALGHLHGRQRLSETVRYSGSPLAYSFSEARQAKGGWLLDIKQGTIENIEPISWPARHHLSVLEGEIDQLLDPGQHQDAEEAWCQITVTDPQRPPQAYQRLKNRFPGLLNFILAPSGPQQTETKNYAQKIDDAVDDVQICTDFIGHVRGRDANENERDLMSAALEQARLTAAEARR